MKKTKKTPIPYEIGSVHTFVRPSVLLSGRFLGTVSLLFCKFWHDARNPYEVVHDRAEFSIKIVFAPKITKMDQRRAKSKVFKNLLRNLAINFY